MFGVAGKERKVWELMGGILSKSGGEKVCRDGVDMGPYSLQRQSVLGALRSIPV